MTNKTYREGFIMHYILQLLTLTLITFTIVSCGGGSNDPVAPVDDPEPNVSISEIQISPSGALAIPKFTTLSLFATAIYSDGTTLDVTANSQWSSTDTSVAMTNSELVTAVTEGITTIQIEYDGIIGSTILTVISPELIDISVESSTNSIALGESLQMNALGIYRGGISININDSVIWSSSNTGVAFVGNLVGEEGKVWPISTGDVSISAMLGNVSDEIQISILPAMLTNIQVMPTTSSVIANNTEHFVAIGEYSDGTARDITSLVVWTSTNDSIATVSNNIGTEGLAVGLSPGNTLISANLGSITTVASLDVLANPDGAASVSVLAIPNVILNNGLDTSTITATVMPNDMVVGVIFDGTIVDFATVTGNLTTTSMTTISGSVSSVLTSTVRNSVEVEVTVRDTAIVGTVNVSVVNSFADAFTSVGIWGGVLINDYIQAGSTLTTTITNSSNRTFQLTHFILTKDNVYVTGTTNSLLLSDNDIVGGESVSLTATLTQNLQFSGFVGTYYLEDVVTGSSFVVSVAF